MPRSGPRGRSARLRHAACAYALAAALLPPGRAAAEMTVPVELQVDLMRRVVRFERGLAARAGDQVKLLIVLRGGHAASEQIAAQLGRALGGAQELAGKPLKVAAHRFSSPAALKQAVMDQGAQLIYLAPGLEAEMGAIAVALTGVPAITISTDGDQVDRGAVLGFELVSARPKIALNVSQAKRQGLDFNSDLFRLARLVK